MTNSGAGGEAGPGVHAGAIQWREIVPARSTPDMGLFSGLIAFDGDGDGEDELALFDYSGPVQLYSLGGKKLGEFSHSSTYPACAWDCDGDGRQELICHNYGDSIQALGEDGRVVKDMPYSLSIAGGGMGAGYRLVGDADGDGKPELWLSPGSNPRQLEAVDYTGRVVFEKQNLAPTSSPLVCDTNGDGRAELVSSGIFGELEADGVGLSRKFGQIGIGRGASSCLDADGDGKPDLVVGEEGYFTQQGDSFVKFTHDAKFNPGIITIGRYLEFDFDGDGTPEQVYVGPDAGNLRDPSNEGRVRVFQPATQSVLYDEVFADGSGVNGTVATSGGRQHLVLQLNEKLMIYP
jgi:hypothetical protein